MKAMLATCPKCGQEIPTDAPNDLCPRCLFADGLATADGSRPNAVTDPDAASTLHIVIPEDAGSVGPAPERLGKYELLEEVAQGGMGIIYKARHTGLDSIVAVKVIRSGVLASPADVERFQREARAAARLHHPNIVTIHDIGEQNGRHYFSMDYVPGANLAELARVRPFAPKAAAAIAEGIASAIHYAHQQGVLHRDLKPANVILTPDQRPRVLDFGLARVAQDDSQLTQSGAPMGTPCYMPPEQAAGRIHSIDERSDVYALGALLYELLTGRPPFQAASTVETLRLVLESDPVPPRRLNPTLPLDLETICLTCLEKEPGKRYPDAQEFAKELGRFLRDEPIRARPISQIEKGLRWCRRRPLIAGLAAAVVLLLIAVAFSSTFAAWRISTARNAIRQALYAADMKQVQQAWDSGNARLAVSLLKAQIPQRRQEDLRGFEWRYFWNLCQGQQAFTFHAHPNPVGLVAFSADGRTVFSHSSSDDILEAWDLTRLTDSPIRTANFPNFDSGAAASADGKVLAITQLGAIRVVDADTFRDLTASLSIDSRVSYHLALSSDHRWLTAACDLGETAVWDLGSKPARKKVIHFQEAPQSVAMSSNLLAISGRRGAFELWNLADDKELIVPHGETSQSVSFIVFSPDGETVALARGSTIEMLDHSKGSLVSSALRSGSNIDEPSSLAFSPDGKMLAAGIYSGAIELWDISGQRLSRSLLGHTGRVNSLAFSPDGRGLVSGGEDTSVRLWNLTARAAENAFRLPAGPVLTCAALSPDGRTLALGSLDRTIILWDTVTRSAKANLAGHQQPILALAYSPDGQVLASASGDDRDISGPGAVKLWDAATGRDLGALPGLTNIVCGVGFSPDGKTLALACPYSAELWDVATRRELTMLAGHKDRVRTVAFAPDGRTVATGSSDKTIKLWAPHSNSEIASIGAGGEGVGCVAFSQDGRLLAAGGDGLSIGLWNVTSKRRIAALDGHKVRTISTLAFSPDTKTLASGGADGTVRLWNVVAQREVATFDAHPSAVVAVLFSHDGTTLLSASADGTVRCWTTKAGATAVKTTLGVPIL